MTVQIPTHKPERFDLAMAAAFGPKRARELAVHFVTFALGPNTPQKTPGGGSLLGFDQSVIEAIIEEWQMQPNEWAWRAA